MTPIHSWASQSCLPNVYGSKLYNRKSHYWPCLQLEVSSQQFFLAVYGKNAFWANKKQGLVVFTYKPMYCINSNSALSSSWRTVGWDISLKNTKGNITGRDEKSDVIVVGPHCWFLALVTDVVWGKHFVKDNLHCLQAVFLSACSFFSAALALLPSQWYSAPDLSHFVSSLNSQEYNWAM